jgi:hypothetical protein
VAEFLSSHCMSYFGYANSSVLHEQDGINRYWIQTYAENKSSSDNAEWAEAWFELDGLMHRTCHLSPAFDAEHYQRRSQDSLSSLIEDHRKWRERKVVHNADEMERMSELLAHVNLASTTNSFFEQRHFSPILPAEQPPQMDTPSTSGFLNYPSFHISDYFFASRLNNWRAIELYISLIQKPMWGTYDGARFVCAVDLCRTHAALGAERNFLGAEKACGLYLAGVVFGGPDMYSVCTQMYN